jgi:hypothetical protein
MDTKPIEWQAREMIKVHALNGETYNVTEGYMIKKLDAGYNLEYDHKTGGYRQVKGISDEDRGYSAFRENSNNKYVFDNN